MEISAVIIIAVIIIFMFRKPIKRASKSVDKLMDHLNDSAVALALEGKEENTRRSLEAMEKLRKLGGPVDFDSLYEQACGRTVEKKK